MKNYLLLVLLIIGANHAFSQDSLRLTAKDSTIKSSWVVGIGFNAVDDSGDRFDQLFAVSDEWNMVPFPSRLNVGRNFSSGIGLEAIASYNKYKAGKIVDKKILLEDVDYYALDTRITYALNKIWGGSKWFDPYLGGGLGYTNSSDQGRSTYNGIIGFKIWFSDRFGLDFNSTGKWSIDKDKGTNHIQHAVSGLYRFSIKKGLTKKGEEKLAMLQALEKEQQRLDSIAAADKAKEAALLAERMAQEMEDARLAALDKAKQEAALIKKMHDELSGLTKMHYTFNSSYLKSQNKEKLNELVGFMNKYPKTVIVVKGHTDSRGASTYNDWLSKRRAENVVKYIISMDVPSNRISAEGFGETQLINKCSDGVRCSNREHTLNRRIEYVLD